MRREDSVLNFSGLNDTAFCRLNLSGTWLHPNNFSTKEKKPCSFKVYM